MFPTRALTNVPTISKDQMVVVDEVMVDELGIGLMQMMENAGTHLARLVIERYLKNEDVERVVVLAGSGGNGGGGLVAARRLAGWDVPVSVWTAKPIDAHSGVIADQLRAAINLGITVDADGVPNSAGHGEVIIDALVGYSLSGHPRGRVASLIRWSREAAGPVISLDIPSGIESTRGEVFDPAIIADVTMTLAMPKTGLFAPGAHMHVGDVYLADIGVPASLYRETFDIEVGDLFQDGDIIQLTRDADG